MPAENLNLTFEQLACVELKGCLNGYSRIFRIGDDDEYASIGRKKLTNPEVRAINQIIHYLSNNPFDVEHAKRILTDNATGNKALFSPLGELHQSLMKAILTTPPVFDHTFDDSRTVGCPVDCILNRLEEHKMRETTYEQEWGSESDDIRPPLYDWMFDDTLEVTNAFIYLLVLLSEVL